MASDLTCQLSLFDVFRDICDMRNMKSTALSSTEKELLAHCISEQKYSMKYLVIMKVSDFYDISRAKSRTAFCKVSK